MALTIEVCLTPKLINQHLLEGKIAVVVDVFRATSCMITALSENVTAIYPVSTVEACLKPRNSGDAHCGRTWGYQNQRV